jgi:excisionase family DNA binding protein
MTKHAYTVKEASETTGLSRSLLYVEIKRGRLGIRKLGARTIILDEELQRWLSSLPNGRARHSRGDA